MPSMPRPKESKATRIAYKILGVPDNLKDYYKKPKMTKKEREVQYVQYLNTKSGLSHQGFI